MLPIRSLRADEEPPSSPPRKYIGSHGYVRLRWRIGNEHVEAYEHRIVMNAKPGEHVHHIDHVRTNNDPSNLRILTPEQHRAEHAEEHRSLDVAVARELYEAGLGTERIGKRLGFNPTTIYRALVDAGVPMRRGYGGPQRKRPPA